MYEGVADDNTDQRNEEYEDVEGEVVQPGRTQTHKAGQGVPSRVWIRIKNKIGPGSGLTSIFKISLNNFFHKIY